MKAIVYRQYGQPDVLQLEEIAKPTPKSKEVLIKVHAISLNSSDWEFLTAKPFYIRFFGPFKPKFNILGTDVAGVVEAVGEKVTQFQPGDAVLGDILGNEGGLAEYVCAPEKSLVKKPESLSFEQAAAMPQAGVVALQGIRDHIQAEQQVLINGAGGGSGSFAIQLAKMYGAEVTAVDSGIKLDFMKSLGANHVIDYTAQDFTQNGQQYDLILDLVAHRSIFSCRPSLTPKGKYLVVGGSMKSILQAAIVGPFISRKMRQQLRMLVIKPNQTDLQHLLDLVEAGKLKPMIDRQFPLAEAAEAMRWLGEGKALGKVVVRV